MLKQLFLEGRPQSGKTSLIISALGERIRKSGGFGTLRLHSESGEVCGYCHVPAKDIVSADSDYFPEAKMFIDIGGKHAKLNPSALVFTEKLLSHAHEKEFAVLDEIGGFELCSEGFSKALYGFLDRKTPCIGVLKSPPDRSEFFSRAGLSDEYLEKYKILWDYLSTDPETEIFHFEHEESGLAEKKIALWIYENRLDIEER